MAMRSKKELEVKLSYVRGFSQPQVALEQYSTPSAIAADWLWNMHMMGDLDGKSVLDAGCGPGILGIGAAIMGATVHCIDSSGEAIKMCERNAKRLDVAVRCSKGDIEDVSEKVEVVLQNPPFGTKNTHADRLFLQKAFLLGRVVYSMHLLTSKDFIAKLCADMGWKISHRWEYNMVLGATMAHHTKKSHMVRVGVWRFVPGE